MTEAASLLESLSHWEKLEDLSSRFRLPHIPEYELSYFRKLYYPELRRALDELNAAPAGAEARAWRGRVRRIFGDIAGAVEDLEAALDLDGNCAQAHAWLGEADGRSGGLDRAIGLGFEPGFLYRGAALLEKREYEPAASDLNAFVKGRPGSALAWILLGLAEQQLSRRESAARAFEAAGRLNPVCSAAHLLRSRLAKDRATRARYFRKAYDVSPVLGFITLQIHQTAEVESDRYIRRITDFCFRDAETVGSYYRREATQSHFSHFPAEDYAFISRLSAKQPHLAWAHAFFGRASCYTQGGAPEGVRQLSLAIEKEPASGWFYAWRANARRLLGQNDEALADFNESIRKQPFYHRAFVWRASLYRKLGRPQEALADLDRAVSMDPFYSLTFHERSLARRTLGDWIGAAADLDRAFLLDHRYGWVFKTGREATPEELSAGAGELTEALRRHPSAASLWTWRGQLQLQRGDFSKAFEDLERAVQADPHHALAHGWRAYGELLAGRPGAAAESARRALELEPRFWIANQWLARALSEQGREKEAFGVLDRVLKLKPQTPWARYWRARFLAGKGRRKQAVRELERALLLDGKYPDAYFLMAEVLLASGDAAGAAKAAEKCIEIAPNLGRAYVLRAGINQALGRPERSIEDYRRLLAEFPYLLNREQREEVEALLAR